MLEMGNRRGVRRSGEIGGRLEGGMRMSGTIESSSTEARHWDM
jgi:hypothetical protein